MGAFHSTTMIKSDYSIMSNIAEAVARDFENENYKVKTEKMVTGGYVVSVTKGNLFKAILGLQTALKVTIKPVVSGISVDAGVGLFGLQSIPSLITLLYAWPVLLTQVWGLIKQAELDDRAIAVACDTAKKVSKKKLYCPHCGTLVGLADTVCPHCNFDLRYS